MGDTNINEYPSLAIQQYSTKIAFLIDCDGGLNAAFSKKPTPIEPDLIKDFPSNSDIFLFFNTSDSTIVTRMKKLESDNPNVHAFPNIIPNAPNGADMNLSFILGAINNKYDDYVIIVRYDRAYEEIKERLEKTNPRLKNHIAVQHFKRPDELIKYARELNKAPLQGQGIANQMLSADRPTSPITVNFTSENIFRHCPLETWQESSCLYRFKELLQHLDDKHPEARYQYCSTCEEMKKKDDRSMYRLFQQHLQKEHFENDAGFHLSILSP